MENRGWSTRHRGRLYIHAAKTFDEEAVLPLPVPVLGPFQFGVVLGYVDLLDCVLDSTSVWAIGGMHHWVTANPVRLAHPVDLRGMPGLFSCDQGVLEAGDPDAVQAPLF